MGSPRQLVSARSSVLFESSGRFNGSHLHRPCLSGGDRLRPRQRAIRYSLRSAFSTGAFKQNSSNDAAAVASSRERLQRTSAQHSAQPAFSDAFSSGYAFSTKRGLNPSARTIRGRSTELCVAAMAGAAPVNISTLYNMHVLPALMRIN
jgi:hypothetical protein